MRGEPSRKLGLKWYMAVSLLLAAELGPLP